MSIVTKTGDKGQTGLFGGKRIGKDDVRMEVIGTIDELTAMIGVVLSEFDKTSSIHEPLSHTQNMLFRLGADIATPREDNKAVVPRIEKKHIKEVEEWIAKLEETPLPPYFILPGGSKAAAQLHLARAICRRAERAMVALSHRNDLGPDVLTYVNRLGDYLFLAALEANRATGIEDVRVSYE
jgi:cob(I)alamin adenosyltransferase